MVRKKKQLYVVIHTHEGEASTYLVRCSHYPAEWKVIEVCGINFNPTRCEEIRIYQLRESPTLTIRDIK